MCMKPSYGWLLKWILAAILIAVGLTMFFQKDLVFFNYRYSDCSVFTI